MTTPMHPNVQLRTKKPVTIEAIQLDTKDTNELEAIARWCDGAYIAIDHDPTTWSVHIRTLEGTMEAKNGEHWIIKGINGEFYPCRNDIFAATYD